MPSARCPTGWNEMKQHLCVCSTALLHARCRRQLTILNRWLTKGPFPAAAKPTLFTGLFKVPSPSTLWLNVSSPTRAITRTPKLAAVGERPTFSRPNAACKNHVYVLIELCLDPFSWQRYTHIGAGEMSLSATHLSEGGAGKHKH